MKSLDKLTDIRRYIIDNTLNINLPTRAFFDLNINLKDLKLLCYFIILNEDTIPPLTLKELSTLYSFSSLRNMEVLESRIRKLEKLGYIQRLNSEPNLYKYKPIYFDGDI